MTHRCFRNFVELEFLANFYSCPLNSVYSITEPKEALICSLAQPIPAHMQQTCPIGHQTGYFCKPAFEKGWMKMKMKLYKYTASCYFDETKQL